MAAEVAERIRRRIDERLFRPPEAEDVIRVTVSIGLAAYPNDAPNKKELVDRADAALYRAKRGGKNAVVSTSPTRLPHTADDALSPPGPLMANARAFPLHRKLGSLSDRGGLPRRSRMGSWRSTAPGARPKGEIHPLARETARRRLRCRK